jgi:hypothetical protein
MHAIYLIRFDDICETTDLNKWNLLKKIIYKYDIKPLLGVVPNNKDSKLIKARPHKFFWAEIRKYQKKGWFIGSHGLSHKLRPSDHGIIGINNISEFVGLSLSKQKLMIEQALSIFRKNGINVDFWMPPAHGLDITTLQALKINNIKVISEGLYHRPIERENVIFVPQQLWKPRKMFFGFWTISIHSNNISMKEINDLENFIKENKEKIKSLDYVLSAKIKKYNLLDFLFSLLLLSLIRFKKYLR